MSKALKFCNNEEYLTCFVASNKFSIKHKCKFIDKNKKIINYICLTIFMKNGLVLGVHTIISCPYSLQ